MRISKYDMRVPDLPSGPDCPSMPGKPESPRSPFSPSNPGKPSLPLLPLGPGKPCSQTRAINFNWTLNSARAFNKIVHCNQIWTPTVVKLAFQSTELLNTKGHKFEGQRSKCQNDPTMHRSYVRLLYPDNMMQLPYIVASNGPHKFVTLPNKIFKLMFIISRL